MADLTKEQLKAIHAKKSTSPIHRTLADLERTSGKMGGFKSGRDFVMHGGKVVTPSEKIKLQKQKEEKEKEKQPFQKMSNVSGREKQKQDIIKKLKDKGFKLTTEISKDPDDPDDEGTEFTTIRITEKQTLDAINGKRSALEINDFITGITEDERLRHDIDVSNNLGKLEEEGKIKIENGVWKKVI